MCDKYHFEECKKEMRGRKKGCIPWNRGKKGMYKHSEETKEKLRIASSGKNNYFYGKHHSEETKKKLRKANLGKIISEETRKRISKSQLGRKHSKKTKKKMSSIHKKLWEDKNWREKTMKMLRDARKKRPTFPEKKFMEICKNNNLPFKYVGQSEIWINGKNPDFINIDGKKEIVEIFGRAFHTPNYGVNKYKDISYSRTEKGTIEHYKKYGFKCIILWDDELINEELVLSKIQGGLK